MPSPLRYQEPESPMTLAEGLAEYRAWTPGLMDDRRLSPEAAALFRLHDLCHVLFGCDVSPEQEMELNAWVLFGTTRTLRQLREDGRVPEVRAVQRDFSRRIGHWGVLRLVLRSAAVWWRVFLRSRRMRGRWPVERSDTFLHRPLHEIRAEFNIEIARPG